MSPLRDSDIALVGGNPATIQSINVQVRQATASAIVLAIGGAVPDQHCLETLLDTLNEHPDIHAVSPLLIAPDATVFSAGAIVWRHGAIERYAPGEPPTRLEHQFRRDLAVALPCYLLIRRDAFLAVDGFDEDYATLEYAVADLCLRMRGAGGRIVYQPRAGVGRVVPLDAGPAHEAACALDCARLGARHAVALDRSPYSPSQPSERLRLLARDGLCIERMLVVDDRVPGADRGSGDPRMLRLVLDLLTLWPGLRLTFIALRPIEPERYTPALQSAGVEVIYECDDWLAWFTARRYHYGVVMVSKPQSVDWLLRQTQPQAFRIYDAEALVFRRLERMLPYLIERKTIEEVTNQIEGVRALEMEYLNGSDVIVCVTPDERRTVQRLAPGAATAIVPHGVDIVDPPAAFDARDGLVYFGGFMGGPGSPNEDALLYLVERVLPLLQAEIPDLRLFVVGADPTPAVLALDSDAVRVVGYVPDAAEWLSRARVHLAPLRFGAGVKLKLIDTMAAGLPFVTTKIGAEGLRLGQLRSTLVAETPEDLARLTLRLYTDRDLWQTVHRDLLAIARQYFGRDAFQAAIRRMMREAGFRAGDAVRPGAPASLARA